MITTRRAAIGALLAGSAAAPGVMAAMRAQESRRPGDYMAAGLRDRVERLKADVRTAATGPSNYLTRSMVLYEWADAYALTGKPIHSDLISTVSTLQQPTFPRLGERAKAATFANLDLFVRTLAALEADPALVGVLTATTAGPLRAGAYASFRQTYTIGSAPIEKGGGFVCPNHFYFAGGEYQAEDPKAPNYVTISASRGTARFAADRRQMAGMFSGRLGAQTSPRLFFRLDAGELLPGDRVTVTFGDRSGGSPGLQLVPWSNSALRFPLWILTAPDGILITPPEHAFESVGGPVAGVAAFAPSIVAVGEAFEMSIRAEDETRNLATGGAPAWLVYLGETLVRKVPASRSAITVLRGLKLSAGVHRFAIRSADGRITADSNPILVEADPKERIFWGETHAHCGFSEGMGQVDAFFKFARDEARLDFVCLSEHDLWMDAWEWGEMRRAAKAFDAPGRFTAYMGYEWTVDADLGGHHNVVFRGTDGVAPAHRIRHPTLPDLYRGLRKAHDPRNVLIIPHAHMPADWTQTDPDMETMVEIVSEHGTFEWFGQKYLAEGHMVGFVGADDNHIGHPGYKTRPKGPGYTFDGNGGLAAVLAPRHDRDVIFDALKERRAYATTQERIILRTRLNSGPMGVVAPMTATRVLEGAAHGTAAIESITLVKNGVDHEVFSYDGPSGPGPSLVEIRFDSSSYVAPKTQSRTARVWEGAIRLSGGRITSLSSPQVERLNRLNEWVRVDPSDPSVVKFRIATRGHAKAIRIGIEEIAGERVDLTLDMPTQRIPLRVTFPAPRAGASPFIVNAPDLDAAAGGPRVGQFSDPITVRRIQPATERDRIYRFLDDSPPARGDYYYVRVVQADGGMAWSSPVWIGGLPRRAS